MHKRPLWQALCQALGGRRRSGQSVPLTLLLCGLLALSACGRLHPQPAGFDPQAYTPIEYQDLLAPGPAGLHAGQKVRVKAFFWQYVDYDPAMVRNYLTLLRYPIRWYELRWFATYGTENLTGYYDLAAITPEQAEQYQLQRLDPILIYGELSPLSPGLFLQVFYIEKIPAD
ncbi:MAG: hypothetical protein WC443_06950 [Desulfobaccales bacterium]